MSPPITSRPTENVSCASPTTATGLRFTGPTNGLRPDTDVGANAARATL